MRPLRMSMAFLVETNMAGSSLPAHWYRKGDPRPAIGLVAVPVVQMALQMASSFCIKLSQDVTESHRTSLQWYEPMGRVNEGENFWISWNFTDGTCRGKPPFWVCLRRVALIVSSGKLGSG